MDEVPGRLLGCAAFEVSSNQGSCFSSSSEVGPFVLLCNMESQLQECECLSKHVRGGEARTRAQACLVPEPVLFTLLCALAEQECRVRGEFVPAGFGRQVDHLGSGINRFRSCLVPFLSE